MYAIDLLAACPTHRFAGPLARAVVAGDKAGSKRTKAEFLGVRIVGPCEFAELVKAFIA